MSIARSDKPPRQKTAAPQGGVETETITNLTSADRQRFDELERVIAGGLSAFCSVGCALRDIRDNHLYRETHTTWAAYLKERWSMTRQRADQLTNAADVVEAMSTIVDIVPQNEAQVRELRRIASPEAQATAWKSAVKNQEVRATPPGDAGPEAGVSITTAKLLARIDKSIVRALSDMDQLAKGRGIDSTEEYAVCRRDLEAFQGSWAHLSAVIAPNEGQRVSGEISSEAAA